MERDLQYQSFLVNNNVAGEFSSSDDLATFNSMFSTVSLLSLLTASSSSSSSSTNQEPLLSSLPPCGYGDYGASPASFGFFGSGVTPLSTSNFLGFPKLEPLNFTDYETNLPPIPTPPMPPFNFMFPDSSPSFSCAPTESQVFHRLPDLLSLDHFSSAAVEDYHPSSSSSLGPLRKRARADSLSQRQAVNQQASTLPPQPPSATLPHRSALARQRRQKLSDKTRCLQKLLPWDKKMDTATMLEEAYKYVKFLQAQLAALKSMPAVSSSSILSSSSSSSAAFAVASQRETIGGSFSGLGRLNRNQLLQVLVNSPVAQTTLSSKGCCVFSVEQLGLLERLADMGRVSMGTARNSSLSENRF